MAQDPILVAYGSKYGGTAEIARWIGEALRACGVLAEVRDAREVHSLNRYDAVILGGGLYAGRWHRHARGFARRFTRQLRERPVWLFASGPLDHSLDRPEPGKILGEKALHRAAERVHAQDSTVFGGRLSPDVRGFPASVMAKKVAGDYRNQEIIRAWATGVATQLTQRAR
jgi:menaquinone-dependent protoporphyrinogen oxidase